LSEVSFPLTGTADKRGIGAAWRRTQALQLRRWLVDQRLALLTLSLFALGARLWGLGERSFWLDELISLGSAALNLPDFLFALGVEANMTLYYWMLFFWLRVVGAGASEALIRLPSVVLGTAAIPLVYLLGRRLHSSAAGLAAAALLALNGFHIILSQEARSYSALGILTIGSYLALDRAIQSGRRRDWALHGLVTALAFYCHSYAVFIILAQALFVFSRRSWAALAGLLGSGLLMAVLLAQLAPFLLRQTTGDRFSRLLPPGPYEAGHLLLNLSGGSYGTLFAYLGLAALGIALVDAGARGAAYRNWLLLTWFLVPAALALGISLAQPIFRERYLVGTLPALALLAGVGLTRLPRRAGIVVLGAVFVLSVAARQGGISEVRGNEWWREAVAYAIANAQPGDGWIFISKSGQNGFEYYAGWHWGRNPAAPYADVLEPFDWRRALEKPDYRLHLSPTALSSFTVDHPRIWLVLSHEMNPATGSNAARPVQLWLTSSGYRSDLESFPGVRLRLYQRRSED
jgi:mannosyltransferase